MRKMNEQSEQDLHLELLDDLFTMVSHLFDARAKLRRLMDPQQQLQLQSNFLSKIDEAIAKCFDLWGFIWNKMRGKSVKSEVKELLLEDWEILNSTIIDIVNNPTSDKAYEDFFSKLDEIKKKFKKFVVKREVKEQ